MRVALTGATGFLGSHLKKYLLRTSNEVLEITRQDTLESMTHRISEFKPDIVMHLATYFVAEHTTHDLEKLVDSNLLFGLKVVQAMKEAGCRKFINTGTNWQNWNGEYDVPVSLYAATKTAFEDLIRYFVSAENFQVYNLKLTDTYGTEDRRGKFITKLMELAKTQQPIDLSPGEQQIDLTHQSDVVRAFEHAANMLLENKEQKGFMQSFTVSSGERNSLRKVVALVEEVSGGKINANFGKRPYRRREVMKPIELDPVLPGWKAKVSLREGIKELLHEL